MAEEERVEEIKQILGILNEETETETESKA